MRADGLLEYIIKSALFVVNISMNKDVGYVKFLFACEQLRQSRKDMHGASVISQDGHRKRLLWPLYPGSDLAPFSTY